MFRSYRGFGTKTSDPAPSAGRAQRRRHLLRDPDRFADPAERRRAVEIFARPAGHVRSARTLPRAPFHPHPSPGPRSRGAGRSYLWQLQRLPTLRLGGRALVADHLFATFSYFRERSDGYVHDNRHRQSLGGVGLDNFRAGLLLEPVAHWYLSGNYAHDTGEEAASAYQQLLAAGDPDRDLLSAPEPNAADGFRAGPAARSTPATRSRLPRRRPPVSLTCTVALSRPLCTTGLTYNGVLVRLPDNTPYTTAAGYQATPGGPYVNVPHGNSWNAQLTSNLDFDAGR